MADTITITGSGLVVSDGFHTFEELYEHRFNLYIAFCFLWAGENPTRMEDADSDFETPVVWRSKVHSDGSSYEGWFILGIDIQKEHQISYHLPLSRWNETNFANTVDRAPEWDGHTPDDVLARLRRFYMVGKGL